MNAKKAKRPAPRRWLGLLGGVALVGVVVAAATARSGDVPTSDQALAPVTTIPGGSGSPVEDLSPELTEFAESQGLTLEKAEQILAAQNIISSFLDQVFSHPGFVAGRGAAAEGGALVVVEPGFEDDEAFLNPPAGLTIRAANLPADQRELALRQAEQAARDAAGSSYEIIAYDALDNSYVVWVKTGELTSQLETEIQAKVSAALTTNPDATIRPRETDPNVGPAGG